MCVTLKNILDYEIIFTRQSEDYLKKLDKKILQMIIQGLENIYNDPLKSDILKGDWEGCRKIRKGSYRIIFEINGNIITILKIGHRKHVYKR
jgi:mRNA interferase RelE/StbE